MLNLYDNVNWHIFVFRTKPSYLVDFLLNLALNFTTLHFTSGHAF